MNDKSPRRVVERYNQMWNENDREKIRELVASPYRRHHPGHTEVFTHEDLLRRFDAYQSRFQKPRVIERHFVTEGPFVTLMWDFAFEEGGVQKNWASIEIFKVEDGRITEVWNPNAVAEQYPAGPWPEFTR